MGRGGGWSGRRTDKSAKTRAAYAATRRPRPAGSAGCGRGDGATDGVTAHTATPASEAWLAGALLAGRPPGPAWAPMQSDEGEGPVGRGFGRAAGRGGRRGFAPRASRPRGSGRGEPVFRIDAHERPIEDLGFRLGRRQALEGQATLLCFGIEPSSQAAIDPRFENRDRLGEKICCPACTSAAQQQSAGPPLSRIGVSASSSPASATWSAVLRDASLADVRAPRGQRSGAHSPGIRRRISSGTPAPPRQSPCRCARRLPRGVKATPLRAPAAGRVRHGSAACAAGAQEAIRWPEH